MRSFIGVSLLALLAGCGNDDADGVFVTATWLFRSVTVNTPQACPEGFDTVVVHARAANGARCNDEGDQVCSEPNLCSDGMGTSRRLLPNVYEVWLEVTSDTGASVYAVTAPERIDLTLGDKSYARQIFVDGGVFDVAWTLRGTDGSPRSCEQASVAAVIVTTSDEADPSSANSSEIPCERERGYTFPYLAGSYTVSLEAVDENGQTRGLSDTLTGQVVSAPNGITSLGTVDISLSSGL